MTTDMASGFDPFIGAIQERKATDVVVLDVAGLSSIADFFIICSGRSNRQVAAIAEHIERTLKKNGVQPLSVEGKSTGHWILMDYGHIIIHIFFSETREMFDLEGLWSDAPRVPLPSLLADENRDVEEAQDEP